MPNRLAAETSPYLLQHKDNPVDWFPWGDEAFGEAARRDAPVLLSVGYSTCHWCHVMERESFENEETAELMNGLFVPVKVDREERPDVDAIYMEAVQAMTGRGGWPMTVFLTPDRRPFFAGTYFPDVDRHGMPSFRRVLGAVHEAWTERRDQVAEQAARIAAAIGRSLPAEETIPGPSVLESAYRVIRQQFDETYGGFGGAPKFPQEPVLEFLLRIAGREWAPEAERMLVHTLERMAAGGIYDQLGGGFSRYAVDQVWLVPHFEKMLYNNAELARIYLQAWQVTGIERFRTVAVETLEYLRRDMTHPDGGVFAAEDADSEGVEGKFYVFTAAELAAVVGEEVAPLVGAALGVSEAGNFEGSNVLHRPLDSEELAARFSMTADEVDTVLGEARRRLAEARATRVRPGLDDKVVAEWNGLALRALAVAGAALEEPAYLEDARRIARFVTRRHRGPDGLLVRTWAKGRASARGFLADQAAMAVGLYTLYQATGELEWYESADQLTSNLRAGFDGELGIVYATTAAATDLITRPVDQQDNPTASGASLAAEALLLQWLFSGDAGAFTEFERIATAGAVLADRAPLAAGHLLAVLSTYHRGMREVAVVGAGADTLAARVWSSYRPHVVLAVDRDGDAAHTVPLLADRHRPGETLAYVCERMVCVAPVTDGPALEALL